MELIEEATGDEFITNLPKVNKNTYFNYDLNLAERFYFNVKDKFEILLCASK